MKGRHSIEIDIKIDRINIDVRRFSQFSFKGFLLPLFLILRYLLIPAINIPILNLKIIGSNISYFYYVKLL